MHSDFLFFYLGYIFSNNLKCMKKINTILKTQNIKNPFLSIFLCYLYIILGIQADFCMKYIMNYIKKQYSLFQFPNQNNLLPLLN